MFFRGLKISFAGYGYWSGLALNKLPVYFEISKLPEDGFCELNIAVFEVSSEQPPLFRCTINGDVYEQQLNSGLSGKTLENLKSNTQKIIFKVPVSILKKGINEVVFQNMTGNWCVFDAIIFSMDLQV